MNLKHSLLEFVRIESCIVRWVGFSSRKHPARQLLAPLGARNPSRAHYSPMLVKLHLNAVFS